MTRSRSHKPEPSLSRASEIKSTRPDGINEPPILRVAHHAAQFLFAEDDLAARRIALRDVVREAVNLLVGERAELVRETARLVQRENELRLRSAGLYSLPAHA